jgi:hypothetical protein
MQAPQGTYPLRGLSAPQHPRYMGCGEGSDRKGFIMSALAAKLAAPAKVPAEVPGLAYFTEAPANLPVAPAPARPVSKLDALEQMFAYYSAE